MVQKDKDYWADANDFVKEHLPKDLEQRIRAFMQEKKYNANECKMFKFMLQSAVDFPALIADVKLGADEQE